MQTLLLTALEKAKSPMPKAGVQNIKLSRSGDGSGILKLWVAISAQNQDNQVVSISGGVIITPSGTEVQSMPLGYDPQTLGIKLTQPTGFLHFGLNSIPTLRFFRPSDTSGGTAPKIDFGSLAIHKIQGGDLLLCNLPDFNRSVSGITKFTPLDGTTVGIREMFNNIPFNMPVDHIDVSNVSDFTLAFARNIAFDQPLFTNTVEAVSYEGMFLGATAFRQKISVLNFSKATNLQYMMQGASNWDEDISGIDFRLDVSFGDMLRDCGISVANYSKFLVSLNSKNYVNKYIGAHGRKYNASAAAARTELINKGWTIIDGGLA